MSETQHSAEQISRLLDDVDVALVRLNEGTYRTCEACGEEIPAARLDAQPLERSCGAHA